MKTSKILLVIVVLLLIGIGGYYYYSQNKQAAPSPVVEAPQAPEKVTWSYEDMGTNEET